MALGQAGADVIELGVPFSDPLADGATIQHASQRALEQGMSERRALALAARIHARIATPLVLMGYDNPILNLGWSASAQSSAGGHRRADRPRPAARGIGATAQRRRRARHRADLPGDAHQPRRAHRAGGGGGEQDGRRLRLLRLAQRRRARAINSPPRSPVHRAGAGADESSAGGRLQRLAASAYRADRAHRRWRRRRQRAHQRRGRRPARQRVPGGQLPARATGQRQPGVAAT